ncbi:DUF6385 domain-containing protein [Paenibacillus sp. UMB4589-SE434]|uniref:DUF6385 domain-containing protein n=1 Tax=Paenibacillus sp. UMB4589-SE434 TaxID=3046314 RepID=UPI00254D0D7C|nr:DUF6385 domain-containing protein [Paenibacillus sp. UMB4589-SE434]MDK8182894.1 DUF6385 domain-containing protein [Paenibacillus sp. UMB4589-SE434]
MWTSSQELVRYSIRKKFLNVLFISAHLLLIQDTSVASVISYAVKNKGASTLSAVLEISPNGIDFTEDAVATVDAGALKVIVLNRFFAMDTNLIDRCSY